MIKHHDTCTADYPEKVEGELPQQIVEIEGVKQCVDCGAYEVSCDKTHEILGERIARRDRQIARLKARIKKLERQLEFVS